LDGRLSVACHNEAWDGANLAPTQTPELDNGCECHGCCSSCCSRLSVIR